MITVAQAATVTILRKTLKKKTTARDKGKMEDWAITRFPKKSRNLFHQIGPHSQMTQDLLYIQIHIV